MSIKSASLLIALLSCLFLSAQTLGATNNEPEGLPIISGIAKQGQILIADVSGISDADGWAKGKKGKFKYQWLRAGVDIDKETDTDYTLVQADVASKISVRVSYTDGGGTREALESAETEIVVNTNDVPVGSPVITGAATEDVTLAVDTSGISDEDGLGSFSYQWKRGTTTVGSASTYLLGQADVGTSLR